MVLRKIHERFVFVGERSGSVMSQIINARETTVTGAIDGLLAISGGAMARLDGYSDDIALTITP